MTWTKKLSRPIPPLVESLIDRGIYHWMPEALDFDFRLTARRLVGGEIFYKTEEVEELRRRLTQQIERDPTYLPRFIERCWHQSKRLVEIARALGALWQKLKLPVRSIEPALLASWWERYAEEFAKTTPYLAVFPAALDKVLEEQRQKGRLCRDVGATTQEGRLCLQKMGTYTERERKAYRELLRRVREDAQLAKELAHASVQELLTKLPHYAPDLLSQLASYLQEFAWMSISYFAGEPCSLRELLERIKQDVSYNVNMPSPFPSSPAPRDYDLEHELLCVRAYRKDALELSGFYVRPLLRAIAERLGINYADLLYLSDEEILKFLDDVDKGFLSSTVERRKQGVIVAMEDGKIVIDLIHTDIAFKEAPSEGAEGEGEDKVFGVVGNPGYHEGTARVLRNSDEAGRVQPGEVLIVRVLTPDFYLAYSRAGAIVTDEGGLTSHAVAVSRERDIPCVIGTQWATRVFRDGEWIVVDAQGPRGVVKRACF